MRDYLLEEKPYLIHNFSVRKRFEALHMERSYIRELKRCVHNRFSETLILDIDVHKKGNENEGVD